MTAKSHPSIWRIKNLFSLYLSLHYSTNGTYVYIIEEDRFLSIFDISDNHQISHTLYTSRTIDDQ